MHLMIYVIINIQPNFLGSADGTHAAWGGAADEKEIPDRGDRE